MTYLIINETYMIIYETYTTIYETCRGIYDSKYKHMPSYMNGHSHIMDYTLTDKIMY